MNKMNFGPFYKNFYLFTFFILLLFLNQTQAQENIIIINSETGHFDKQNLSYLTPIIFKGNAEHLGEKVIAVEVIVRKGKPNSSGVEKVFSNIFGSSTEDGSVYTTGIWIRTADENDFVLPLERRLEMSSDYIFDFKYYINKTEAVISFDEFLKPVLEEIQAYFKDYSGLTKQSALDFLKSSITKLNNDFLEGKGFKKISNGKILEANFELNSESKRIINNYIIEYLFEVENIKEFSENIEGLKTKIVDLLKAKDIDSLSIDHLLSVIKIEEGQIRELNEELQKFNIDSTNVEKIKTIDKEILNYKRRIKESEKGLKEYEAKILSEVEKITKKFLLSREVLVTSSTKVIGETHVESIRVGTIYGAGAIILNNEFNKQELTQILGINIRMNDFDKRLPGNEAYKNLFSRFSFFIAIATSNDLTYNGMNLENTKIGIKPVVGLNFEPFRLLNLGIGTISFDEINPISGTTNNRLRPFLSMSLDFNIFNQLINSK